MLVAQAPLPVRFCKIHLHLDCQSWLSLFIKRIENRTGKSACATWMVDTIGLQPYDFAYE